MSRKQHSVVPTGDKTPPYSEEAERALLGGCLYDWHLGSQACLKHHIEPESFYVPAHRQVYHGIMKSAEDHGHVDATLVVNILKTAGTLDSIGGSNQIDRMIDACQTSQACEHYAFVVRKKQLLRKVIEAARTVESQAFEDGDPEEILSIIKHEVAGLSLGKPDLISVKEATNRLIDAGHVARKQGYVGIPSRWHDVQKKYGSFPMKEMVVLASRPGQGKTALGINEIVHKVKILGVPSTIYSLEMMREGVIQRIISSEAQVDLFKLKQGEGTPDDFRRIAQVGHVIEQWPLEIYDGNMNITQLTTLMRQDFDERGTQFILIDYLQKIRPTQSKKHWSRSEEVGSWSADILAVGKDCGFATLEISQLNRAPEHKTQSKTNRRIYKPADLRDSGNIEQDADRIIFVHPDFTKVDENDDGHIIDVPYVLDCQKNRNGKTGMIDLLFDKKYVTFKQVGGINGKDQPVFDIGDGYQEGIGF